MPIKQAIWRVGDKPTALAPSSLKDEKLLENMIETDASILAEEWLIIGRQVQTAFGGFVDLLAIAPDGSLVVIELKRHKTPRDVVAQVIDYASWVEGLTADEISGIYENYSKGKNLKDAFTRHRNEDSSSHSSIDFTRGNWSKVMSVMSVTIYLEI
jgi:RecB family endonuclease NucS